MWAIVRRAVVPVLLVIAGVVAIVEGVLYHRIPVLVETETTATIDVPLVLPMVDLSSPDAPPFPGGAPFGGPTSMKKTVTRIDDVTLIISEPELTRDATVGGVVRLASGELKRTYSGKGPAVCPT